MKIVFAVDTVTAADRWKSVAMRLLQRSNSGFAFEIVNLANCTAGTADARLRRSNADIVQFDFQNAVSRRLFTSAAPSYRILTYDALRAVQTDEKRFVSRLRRALLHRKSITEQTDAVICQSALKEAMPGKLIASINESAIQCASERICDGVGDWYYCRCSANTRQLSTLLKAAVQFDVPLHLVVDGDCTDLQRRFGRAGNITFLSAQEVDPDAALQARFVVVIDDDIRLAGENTVASLLAGVPVVTSTLSQAAMFINAENGRLFRADRPDSLADSIAAVWQKRYNRAAIAAEMSAVCDVETDKLLNFYLSLKQAE